ncbi:hypothetical protein CROQUDRAFT_37756 [Cronartium quercuum f. sp. fusiforme G11]|uniref:Uncharacterized protein n=1 Tax=Cronartium quercuum f. sp. fusiforme G11 TaxID=708437 RepID=A0A9P6NUU5_9BASI|nr:hypothetical protein CROQUDRAFT_37756 [Cronartium quercuum f. sp. fusiforme G11]
MALTIPDVSVILGQYMLQGWTLTDVNCPRALCVGCPLMRSKTGSEFCARCDGGPVESSRPEGQVSRSGSQLTISSSATGPDHVNSRASTPLTAPLARQETELEAEAEAEAEAEGMIPIAPPEILAARRAQSDLASSRIGQLLLRGWVLLNGQCEGSDCWAIPLMRSPKNTPTNDPSLKRKWCVICEHDWEAPQPEAKHARTDEKQSTIMRSLDNALPSSSSTTQPSKASDPAEAEREPRIKSCTSQKPFTIRSETRPSTLVQDQPELIHPDSDAFITRSVDTMTLSPDPQVLSAAREAIQRAVGFMTARLNSSLEHPHVARSEVVDATEALGKVLNVYRTL